MTYGNGQGEPKGKEPVDWVVDLFVHTPIGLAVMAWKRVPEFVGSMPDLVGQALSKGCAQLAEAEERISEEVRKARMIGQVAVTFGGRQLRREVDARLRDAQKATGGVASFLPGAGGGPNGAGAPGATVSATATPTAPASPPDAGADPSPAKATATKATAGKATAAKATGAKATGAKATGGKATAAKASAAKPAAARKPAAKPAGARKATKASSAKKASGGTKRADRPAAAASAADLPIPEYDGLSASQVVSRLTGLSPEELHAIRFYEESSRGRRTVLLAIDRLLD